MSHADEGVKHRPSTEREKERKSSTERENERKSSIEREKERKSEGVKRRQASSPLAKPHVRALTSLVKFNRARPGNKPCQ